VTPLTFLGTNLGSWRILSAPLAFSFCKKKKICWFVSFVGCYAIRSE